MPRPAAHLFLVAAALTLAACSTTRKIPLNYVPSDAALARDGRTVPISMGRVEDRREDPGAPIGSLYSGIGNTAKRIRTDQPLTAVVRGLFVDALRQRGSYSPSSPDQLNVEILDFRADQMVRREASIDLLVSLHDARTGYNRGVAPVRVKRMQGGLLNAGNLVVGNVSAFQRFVEKSLSEAVDEGIDRVTPPVAR